MRDFVHENLTDKDAQEWVQELTWALLDEQIGVDEVAHLENLLLSCDEARKTYIECVQLHADLAMHFAGAPDTQRPAAATTSPVLGFLYSGITLLGPQGNSLIEP